MKAKTKPENPLMELLSANRGKTVTTSTAGLECPKMSHFKKTEQNFTPVKNVKLCPKCQVAKSVKISEKHGAKSHKTSHFQRFKHGFINESGFGHAALTR